MCRSLHKYQAWICGAERSGKRTTTNSKQVGALLGPKLGICQIFAEVRSLRHLCVEEEGLFIQIEEKHLLRKFMQEIFPFDIIVPRCGSMGAATVQELTIWPFVVWNIYGKKLPAVRFFTHSAAMTTVTIYAVITMVNWSMYLQNWIDIKEKQCHHHSD